MNKHQSPPPNREKRMAAKKKLTIEFLKNRTSWKYLMNQTVKDSKREGGFGIANITLHLLRCAQEILKELQFMNDTK